VSRRAVRWGGLLATVVVLVVAVFLGTRSPSEDQANLPSPLVGTRAPNFVATTLDGATWKLSEHRGSVVVLNFWASWCGPCVTEAPELSSFAWAHRTNQVVVLGVVFNDSLAAARGFQAHYGSLYPSVADRSGEIANSFGITSPPTTVVIDGNGRVSTVIYGATTSSTLGEAVAEATA